MHRNCEAATCVDGLSFSFRTLADINAILSYLGQWIPDESYILLGLKELMVNAVEHGNLAIGYPLKTKLLENGTWLDEIERRLALKENLTKTAKMEVSFKKGTFSAVIKDKGKGFDVEKTLQSCQVKNETYHGRGLCVVTSLAFDDITFSENGTCVTCIGKICEA